MRYRIHFEPMDFEDANSPQQAEEEYLWNCGMKKIWPEVRKVIPIDKDGFPIQLGGGKE